MKILLGVAMVAATLAIAEWQIAERSSAISGSAHAFLHINCPPGSHVSKTRLAFGQRLQSARDASLAARSLTAGHP